MRVARTIATVGILAVGVAVASPRSWDRLQVEETTAAIAAANARFSEALIPGDTTRQDVAAKGETASLELDRVEVRSLESEAGLEYRLYVALPIGHAESDARYPVVVLLDADYSFLLARNIANHLSDRDHLAKVVLVGVAYRGPLRYRLNRTRDYTPSFVPDGGYGAEYQRVSGGGPEFLAFLRRKVLPFMEANYRTEPSDRTLVGHSYGGLFATYSMLTSPQVFQKYIVVSPSLWYDHRRMFKLEEAAAAKASPLEAKAYFCVGSREENYERSMLDDLETFTTQLTSRNHPNLEIEMQILDNETHNSVFPRGLSNGLRYVFDAP